MKKEYLILTVLILALSTYLVLKKDNRSNYTLPETIKIADSDLTRLTITKKDSKIEITAEKDGWVVTKNNYPADTQAVNTMLDVVKSLKISALVSEKQDKVRYDLDQDNAINVTAFNKTKILLSFKIGKTAPTYNHTFVMLKGDTNIYHADNNFRNDFDKSIDDLRDKQVLTFKPESVKQFTIEKQGISKTLKSLESINDKQETVASWKFSDGSLPDRDVVSKLLSTLSSLKCERFLEAPLKDTLEKQPAECKIILENGAPIVLNLFDKKTEDQVMAISSMSDYAFALSSYTAKEILAQADKLAGLENTDKEKTKDKE